MHYNYLTKIFTYIKLKYKFITKGETFMIEDVKIKYKRNLLKKPSINAILDAVIDYCDDCIAASKKDEISMIFSNFAYTNQIKKHLESCKEEWNDYKAKPNNVKEKRTKRISRNLKEDINDIFNKKSRKNKKEFDQEMRKKIIHKLMYGKDGGGNNPINMANLFQAPMRINLISKEIEKHRINKNIDSLDEACAELARNDKEYIEKIKEIFNNDEDRAIFLKRAKNFAEKVNSGSGKNFQNVIKDLNKWVEG